MNALLSWLSSFSSAPPKGRVVVIRNRDGAPIQSVPRRGQRTMINRIPRPYWDDNGWVRTGNHYEGDYKTRYGSCRGSITESPSGRIEVFIFNPPIKLQNHPHWQCFMPRQGGWYFVHSPEPITDVSAAIISVENILTEAFEL